MSENDENSLDICLVELSAEERNAISKVITKNGGEVRDAKHPSMIAYRCGKSPAVEKDAERRNPIVEKTKSKNKIRNYTRWEQRLMIQYLIENRSISCAKGNRVWQEMIEDGILTHRTYQSLNNHFRKSLLPRINQFYLTPKHLIKFQSLIYNASMKKKAKNT